MYVTILLLHVKMLKSSFWVKNVLEFGFCEWNCINNFNLNTVREITLITFTLFRYMKFI
ncbi:hypothetical protein TU65_16780 [Bacillus wiedmannii]|nr:hypothetical protein TU65_16780 [Bacillus wiedmannii]